MDGFDAFVPIKPLASAKLRLHPTLDASGRADLACALLAHVLRALARSREVARVFVVTQDARAAGLAAAEGVAVAPDAGLGLNAALEAAIATRLEEGAGALAVFQGDLPWLHAEAVDQLLAQVGPGEAAIASDHHGAGTSALAWRAPFAPVRLAFGDDSLRRHAELLGPLARRLTVLERDAAFRDLDDAADLAALRAAPAATALQGVPA